MCYDTPYPLEGVNSTSVDEMEDRLIATYGQPDVLRPESKRQPVQYDPKDLLPGNPLNQGSDLWIFAHGASISMGWCAGHQKEPGGHIFDAESITFSDDSVRTSVTLPAHHPIPITWSKLPEGSGSVPSWRPDEVMTVMVYTGGERTCTVGNPVPSITDDRGTRYSSTMVCTDFIEIGYSPIAAGAPTRIHVLRNNQVLAVGYIPETQAVASLEVH
jgi:hypothetical protein